MPEQHNGATLEPLVTFATANESVAAVMQAAKSAQWGRPERIVHPLSFDRFREDKTDWWIAPGTDNPAYRYPKIIFAPKESKAITTSHLFVGFNVEKGVGPSAAWAYQRPRRCQNYVMDGGWEWSNFIALLAAEKFDSAVAEAANVAEVKCTVAVSIATVVCSERYEDDVHPWNVTNNDDQELRYESEDGSLKFVNEPRCEAGRHIAKPEQITSLSGLAKAIERVDRLDWKWVGFYAGFHFGLAAPSKPDKAWDADAVWTRACLPWKNWVWSSETSMIRRS